MPPFKSQVFFSPEEDVRLAKIVSQHPFIFNAQHELHKDQGMRDNIWKKISEDMKKSRKYMLLCYNYYY